MWKRAQQRECGDTRGNKICVRQNQNAARGTIIRQEPRFRSDDSRGGRNVQASHEDRKPMTCRKRAAYNDTHTQKEAPLWERGCGGTVRTLECLGWALAVSPT